MKIRNVAAGLAGMLVFSSICTTGFCVWHVWSARQNILVQLEVMKINAYASAMHSVLIESADYGKRNPAMLSLLQGLNLLPRNLTNQPSGAAVGNRP